MSGQVSDFIFDVIFWVGVPALFIVSAGAPFFIVKKILKRPLTGLTVMTCSIISVGLMALDVYALYWAFALLQGIAACQLYSDYSVIQCLTQ